MLIRCPQSTLTLFQTKIFFLKINVFEIVPDIEKLLLNSAVWQETPDLIASTWGFYL